MEATPGIEIHENHHPQSRLASPSHFIFVNRIPPAVKTSRVVDVYIDLFVDANPTIRTRAADDGNIFRDGSFTVVLP